MLCNNKHDVSISNLGNTLLLNFILDVKKLILCTSL